jgi:hypothetical protein
MLGFSLFFEYVRGEGVRVNIAILYESTVVGKWGGGGRT